MKYCVILFCLLVVWGCTDDEKTAGPDTTRPTVVNTSPADGESSVPVSATVAAEFSEEMDPTTINANTVNISPDVDGAISYSHKTAIFSPSADLDYGAAYEVRIETGVRDLAGNAMAQTYVWTFTTEVDTISPTIVLISPADGDTGVAVDAGIFMQFSEEVDTLTIDSTTFFLTPVIEGSISYSNQTAIFTATNDFDYNQTYQVNVTTGIKDLAGNALDSTYIWSFTTETD